MTDTDVVAKEYLLEQNKTYMIAVYILFAAGIFTGGLITVVGVILAYIKRKEVEGTIYHDHLNYLIRTFWGVLLPISLAAY